MNDISTIEQNKTAIRAMETAFNSHDLDRVAAAFAEGATNHQMKVGRAGFRAVTSDILTTFPNWQSTIEKLIAEDDWVVEHVRVTGTHLGRAAIPHHGDLRAVEPTGKTFEIYISHFWRLRDSLITEHEAVRDDLTMHRQLGLAT